MTDLARGEWYSLIWGFFWRQVVVSIAFTLIAAVIAGFIGFVAGVIISTTDGSIEANKFAVQVMGFVVGVIVGIWGYAIWVRRIFKVKFPGLRLALLRESGTHPSAEFRLNPLLER